MNAILRVVSIAWRLALALFLVVLTFAVHDFSREGADWAQRQIQREGDLTREAALREAEAARHDMNQQLALARVGALARVDKGLRMEDVQAGDLARRVDAQLSRLNGTVAGLRTDVQPTLKNSERASGALGDELGPALKSFERLSASNEKVAATLAEELPPTAKAVREVTQQAAGIATDVHKATTELTAPTPWYKKLWSVFEDVALIGSHWF